MTSPARRPERGPENLATAIPWSYLLSGGRAVIPLLVSLMLARFLGPGALGLLAMANAYVLFIELVMRQGLVDTLIQRLDLRPEHLDAAFWIAVGGASVLMPLSMAASGWWAGVNQVDDLQGVILALTPILLLRGLALVPDACLRRRMDFRSLALRTTIAFLVGGAVGVAGALVGWGVWSLVAQHLTAALVELAILLMLADWRPRFRFERWAAADLLGSSGRLTVASFGVFVNQRADALLIGILLGPISVGIYRMAARITEMTLEVGAGAIQSVSLPELSRLQSNREQFKARAAHLVRIAAVVTVPLLGAVIAASDALIRFLGPEWSPGVVPLRLLCIMAVGQTVAIFVGPIFQAVGRPGVLARLIWLTAGISAFSFLVAGLAVRGRGVEAQVLAVASARLAVYSPVLFLVLVPTLRRHFGPVRPMMVEPARAAVGATLVGATSAWVAMELLGLAVLLPAPLAAMATSALSLGLTGMVLFRTDPLVRDRLMRLLHRLRVHAAGHGQLCQGMTVDRAAGRSEGGVDHHRPAEGGAGHDAVT